MVKAYLMRTLEFLCLHCKVCLLFKDDAMDSGFLGRFAQSNLHSKVFKRMIDMVDIGEKLGRSQDAETMTEMFLETLLHEIGHGIEGRHLCVT